VDELLFGAAGQFRTQGNVTHGAAEPRRPVSVREVLAGDLDAYLDRELFEAPDSEHAPCDTASVEEMSGRVRALLALAQEETEWLERNPRPSVRAVESPREPAVEIPEWMRTSPDASQVTPLGALLSPRGEGALSRASGSARAQRDVSSWHGVPMSGAGRDVDAERARGAGPRLLALLGSAAVGALTAGLFLVAVQYVREGSQWNAARGVEAAQGSGAAVSGRAGAVPSLTGGPAATAREPQEVPSVQPLASASVSVAGAMLPATQEGLRQAVNGLHPVALTSTSPAPAASAVTLEVARPALSSREVRANVDAAGGVSRAPAAPVELAFGDAEAGGELSRGAVEAKAAAEEGPYADLDEEFARELGFTGDAESLKAQAPPRTVYVPPALDVKEVLTPADVKQVVLTNQPALTACLRSHAQGTAMAAGGRFEVQWSVLPSGETRDVSLDTSALRGTPLSRCIEDVVRRWRFPVHQVRMQAPIRFPFVF